MEPRLSAQITIRQLMCLFDFGWRDNLLSETMV